ncbi:arginyl-tRNA synthetase [Ancylobacter novellus DSM 506]|uniref:Arginine--tRNA ligase n=1 Tax=Ancylobacter novellus (strain ATCC 8093 / DSM 506 / JCM 20403 / CCM 1077 / IAM 12100 / NBRC 12443 / NCIMB 10456) TaxID=639283 RepID=D6ZZ57_ANCN5|nr:arginine--tRNA ligase [Ancylobacter novellus]ADH89193.1 arginyl-tRNA synthetase [Ancylobacter novellus DSM 506]
MNLFAIFADHVRDAVAQLATEGAVPAGIDTTRVVVEPPRDASHGDLATNAAMVLAKDAGMKPRELADKLTAKLAALPGVAKVDVAGPGFINIALDGSYWPRILAAVLNAGRDYGRTDAGAGQKINVEYVSANPTGPMHVGHCRGAVFGDALANLLAFAGWKVTREYYINDAGAQVDVLARSAFLRYREALGETISIPEGLYPGDYLVPVGKALVAKYGRTMLDRSEAEWLPAVRKAAIDAMMAMIRDDLAALNIHHDVFFSERTLHARPDGQPSIIDRLLDELRARNLVYEGRLPPPKGQPIEDWEDREQTLFRATDFGDDVDRPLMKSDGAYTYFAADIAYHKDKYDRGFKRMIDVWGADHGGYVKRMQAAVKAASGGEASLDVELCQLVRLLRAGEPVKMSKRAGDFVTLREVVDEVGRDAVRFMMINRKNDAVLDFDLAKVIEQSRDNPVFYVQYAHARASSILRNAKEAFTDLPAEAAAFASAELTLLEDEGEIALIKLIASYPRIVEQAAAAREPHRLAFYLYDLASALHAQWNRGKDLPHLRFIIEDDRKSTYARLALVHAVALIIASGLSILGVGAPEEMR